jgi:hypothetical protein
MVLVPVIDAMGLNTSKRGRWQRKGVFAEVM